jgi:hypothetical protein
MGPHDPARQDVSTYLGDPVRFRGCVNRISRGTLSIRRLSQRKAAVLPMSHDQNFKNLILDYPRQALAFFAAEEAAGLGKDVRITPLRQEQLKERLGDRFRELDVPLLVEWPDGRREALLFVIEQETQARRFEIHRLVHYCV